MGKGQDSPCKQKFFPTYFHCPNNHKRTQYKATQRKVSVGVFVLHSLIFDSRGTIEVASVRRSWKLPLCPAEPILDSSEDGHDACPIREAGNAPVITLFKKKIKPKGGTIFFCST